MARLGFDREPRPASLTTVRTPAEVLAELVADDATAPLLTFYDDLPGPTQGERIELSRRVVATWVAKAANALQEGLDVAPGSVVLVQLPCPHWRLAYWALAVWSVGATLTLDTHEGADVLVTTDPGSEDAEDADEVIAVTLAALAREHPEGAALRSGVMDEAKELPSFGDGFVAWDSPDPDDTALVADGERTDYEALLPAATWPAGSRVLVTTGTAAEFLQQLLHALSVGGSLVLVRGATPDPEDPRMASERVDLVAG